MNRFALKIICVILVFGTAAVLFNQGGGYARTEKERDFPALHVNTHGFDIANFTRYDWLRVSLSLLDTEGAFEFKNLPASIRGRGQSTWYPHPLYPIGQKRPFRIRLDEPREILNSGYAAAEWTVIANHFDRSLLRQYGAFHLGNLMTDSRDDGLYFSPFHRFIDVYINGEYFGVFHISDQVNEAVEGRSSLRFDFQPEKSEYMLELDTRFCELEGIFLFLRDDSSFIQVNGRYHDIRFPRRRNLTDGHREYALNFMTAVDTAINQRNFDEISRLIDIDSFVDSYLIHEFFHDFDVRRASLFMQIRGYGENRRLYKGPLWDFDTAAGAGALGSFVLQASRNTWFRNLMLTPKFVEATVNRWNEIKDNEIVKTINQIVYTAARYQQSFERNFDVWPIMGVEMWPTPRVKWEIDTFVGQVDYLVDFLYARKAFLDSFFNGLPDTKSIDLNSFHTQNGKRISEPSGKIVSNGEQGFLLFGPYMTLVGGVYEVVFTLSLAEFTQGNVAVLDVGMYRMGTPVIAEFSIYADDFIESSQEFTISFDLSEFAFDVEFRIFTTEGTILTVESVVLSRLSNSV